MTLKQAKALLKKCTRTDSCDELTEAGCGGYEWFRGDNLIAQAFGGDVEDPAPSVLMNDDHYTMFSGDEAKQLVQCFKQ